VFDVGRLPWGLVTSAANGATRALRALALGFTCFAIGLGGHLLAGGPAPTVLAAALTSLPLGCLCLLVTARRCRLGTIGALMVTSQMLLHQVFRWLAVAPTCALPTTGGGHLGHSGSAHLAQACTTTADPMAGMAHSGAGLGPLMVGAHLLAGLGAALLLAYGERLLWELAAALGRPVLVIGQLPRLVLSVRPDPAAYGLVLPVARVSAGPASRRGPPRLVPTTA
jgi:hypothetical protein